MENYILWRFFRVLVENYILRDFSGNLVGNQILLGIFHWIGGKLYSSEISRDLSLN